MAHNHAGSTESVAAPEDQLARLWSGWRVPAWTDPTDVRAQNIPEHLSLFEGIEQSGLADDVTYIVWRGDTCFALLNAYPYTSGHVMVLPKRAARDLDELTPIESAELWHGVNLATAAVKAAFEPHGMNVGINIGAASGAGVPTHLHVHVVPRWTGDTNFMTTVAEARVLPETLGDVWRKLQAVWPTS